VKDGCKLNNMEDGGKLNKVEDGGKLDRVEVGGNISIEWRMKANLIKWWL